MRLRQKNPDTLAWAHHPSVYGGLFPISYRRNGVYVKSRQGGGGITLSSLFTCLSGLCDGFKIHYFLLRSIILSLKLSGTEQCLYNINNHNLNICDLNVL